MKAMKILGRIPLVDTEEARAARFALLRAVRSRHRHNAVRIVAVETLGEMRDTAAMPVLVYQLEHESNPQVRRALESTIAILARKPPVSPADGKSIEEKKQVRKK